MLFLLCLSLGLSSSTAALSVHVTGSRQSGPTVDFKYGTFQGSSSLGVDSFLGIPFAQSERFGLPRTPAKMTGIQPATAFGAACPQKIYNSSNPSATSVVPPGLGFQSKTTALNISEDCLFINVFKPSDATSNDDLPVLFWIFGGGFELGDTSQYDGSTVVARSIELGRPVVYVSANYRLNAFGFLASKEVKAAGVGNLGLQDQQFALQWVQDNVAEFGGDPSKVILWGQSAGAISVGLQLVTNGGNAADLFRGAVMESGSPIPLTDMSAGQPFYDQLVKSTNCSSSKDTFTCLKGVPFNTFKAAVDSIPGITSSTSLQLPWQPRVDGVFFTQNPQNAIATGAYADVPLIIGSCEDEGTLFSFSQGNLTTDQEGVDYFHHNYFPLASEEQFKSVAGLYSSDPTQGSPFDTGDTNQFSPQFKRLAAFQGDLVFQAPRRFFLRSAARTQDTWAFLYKRGKATPFLGAFHGSDVAEFYGSTTGTGTPDYQGTDALVNFANNLDPNEDSCDDMSTLIPWPKYRADGSALLLTFSDPNVLTITHDTYRATGMEVLTNLSRLFP